MTLCFKELIWCLEFFRAFKTMTKSTMPILQLTSKLSGKRKSYSTSVYSRSLNRQHSFHFNWVTTPSLVYSNSTSSYERHPSTLVVDHTLVSLDCMDQTPIKMPRGFVLLSLLNVIKLIFTESIEPIKKFSKTTKRQKKTKVIFSSFLYFYST